jgi:2-polyprenyl-3-methyl-5-hydroxy-6-metoxy-1,4-benzoquinol methylase
MWDVIDHILHPDSVLRRCQRLLKRGGLCFIRTPNIQVHLPLARLKKLIGPIRPNQAYLMAYDHCHHYSTKSIRILLERNGFSDIEFTHLHPISSSRGLPAQRVKSLCFYAVRSLAISTRGHLNFDNLFVVARKES